jgi:glycosyltransferase involved in cell wall biosynthesis
MKVAIVHYWLIGMRGGEKVVEALCDMFPQADIFTHVYVPDAISEKIRRHSVNTSFIAKLPKAARHYQTYLPLMPLALEQLDLRGYDLVISSESGPAKGVIPPPSAVHLCYCHSPMRYLWNMFHEYRASAGFLRRGAMPFIAHYLRMWDVTSAARVDQFVANSHNVAARIHRYYGRTAGVVNPPVDVAAFEKVTEDQREDYMLMVGELVAYKRPELAIRAFNQMKARLVVIGGGELLAQMRHLAGPTVSVLGPRPFADLRHHYARCKALIFPGEEDFGIVPVEAMASGTPVIAYGRGGALETVIPNLSGMLFEEASVDAIIAAVRAFNDTNFDADRIMAHAEAFRVERFTAQMKAQVDRLFAARGLPSPAMPSVGPRYPLTGDLTAEAAHREENRDAKREAN